MLTTQTKPVKTMDLSTVPNIDINQGTFKVDIAVWLKIEKPAQVIGGKLKLKYTQGNQYKTMLIDKLTYPTSNSALLSGTVSLPGGMRNSNIQFFVEISGSNYKVDHVHCLPRTSQKVTHAMWAA